MGLWALPGVRRGGALLSLAITVSVCFYHLAMRLAVGAAVAGSLRGRINPQSFWFRSRPWEAPLYRFLRVKRWKDHMPTYDPAAFDPARRSLEALVRATCQAEIVHTLSAVLSFLPLAAVPWAGALPVFLLTSLGAAVLDLSFVLIQRYNRPRIQHLLDRKKQQS